MVNYRDKLNIDFNLSDAQIKVLEKSGDTIVRAIPGSGKTTILTLKIKHLLQDDSNINQICCISYTNVNVEDLEKSCTKKISSNDINKINFLTFHRFCLEYILNPFSYLYRSKKGLRPYKKIFNYKEHGDSLLKYLSNKGSLEEDIQKIKNSESIFYNFEFKNNQWVPISNAVTSKTVVSYLNFLNKNRMIDFNLINLLSLFIIQENKLVRVALNKAIDWIFIDEFQDVSEIQCKIIEEIRKSRNINSDELKWFLVGDPNQSIYGFAGANPKSMYDTKQIFNDLNKNNCEIKLDKTHRCPEGVFNFVRKNYNEVLKKIKDSDAIKALQDPDIINYVEDLFISEDVTCNNCDGVVIFKNTLTSISEILDLKFSELVDDEVCCIGVNKYNSIDVYRQYKLQTTVDDGEDFGIYSELYKDYEDKYGFKYFSLFVRYLILKNDFYNYRIRFHTSINKYKYLLRQLIIDRIPEDDVNNEKLFNILNISSDLFNRLNVTDSVSLEFNKFSKRLVSGLNEYFPDNLDAFMVIDEENKIKNFNNISEPTIGGFIKFTTKTNKEKITFEIKHIHKIKGLEYDNVIVQKIEDLPHKSYMNKAHQAIFYGKQNNLNAKDIYDYIQELNKLYVMLTRSKKNLYIIVNSNKLPDLVKVETENVKIPQRGA